MDRPWIVYFCFAVLGFMVIAGLSRQISQSSVKSPTESVISGPLLAARMQHQTQLIRVGPSPQSGTSNLAGKGFKVQYQSGGRVLNAWLIKPTSMGSHPGMLYCHHGYALGQTDIAAIQPFVDAGFIVLMPEYRGENGNPGNFEMFYGEVDDARAALDALTSIPAVDHNLVFATGFGAGGTIAMLLAESGATLTGVYACGAFLSPDADTPPFNEAPVNWKDPIEQDLRSPARHLQDLQCPVHLYYGEAQTDLIRQAQPVVATAQALKKTVTLTIIRGADESNVVTPWVNHTINDMNPYYTPPPPVVIYAPDS